MSRQSNQADQVNIDPHVTHEQRLARRQTAPNPTITNPLFDYYDFNTDHLYVQLNLILSSSDTQMPYKFIERFFKWKYPRQNIDRAIIKGDVQLFESLIQIAKKADQFKNNNDDFYLKKLLGYKYPTLFRAEQKPYQYFFRLLNAATKDDDKGNCLLIESAGKLALEIKNKDKKIIPELEEFVRKAFASASKEGRTNMAQKLKEIGEKLDIELQAPPATVTAAPSISENPAIDRTNSRLEKFREVVRKVAAGGKAHVSQKSDISHITIYTPLLAATQQENIYHIFHYFPYILKNLNKPNELEFIRKVENGSSDYVNLVLDHAQLYDIANNNCDTTKKLMNYNNKTGFRSFFDALMMAVLYDDDEGTYYLLKRLPVLVSFIKESDPKNKIDLEFAKFKEKAYDEATKSGRRNIIKALDEIDPNLRTLSRTHQSVGAATFDHDYAPYDNYTTNRRVMRYMRSLDSSPLYNSEYGNPTPVPTLYKYNREANKNDIEYEKKFISPIAANLTINLVSQNVLKFNADLNTLKLFKLVSRTYFDPGNEYDLCKVMYDEALFEKAPTKHGSDYLKRSIYDIFKMAVLVNEKSNAQIVESLGDFIISESQDENLSLSQKNEILQKLKTTILETFAQTAERKFDHIIPKIFDIANKLGITKELSPSAKSYYDSLATTAEAETNSHVVLEMDVAVAAAPVPVAAAVAADMPQQNIYPILEDFEPAAEEDHKNAAAVLAKITDQRLKQRREEAQIQLKNIPRVLDPEEIFPPDLMRFDDETVSSAKTNNGDIELTSPETWKQFDPIKKSTTTSSADDYRADLEKIYKDIDEADSQQLLATARKLPKAPTSTPGQPAVSQKKGNTPGKAVTS